MKGPRHPRLATRMVLLLVTSTAIMSLYGLIDDRRTVNDVCVLYVFCLLGISGFVVY